MPSPRSRARPSVRWVAQGGTVPLDRLEAQYVRLRRGANLAEWRLRVGRGGDGSLPWQHRIHELFHRDGLLAWSRRYARVAKRPRDRWRAELLGRLVTDAEVEQHPSIAEARACLEREVYDFRPLWRGRRTGRAVVRAHLKTERTRSVRATAWAAEEPLHRSLEPGVRLLARLRNERARELGYRSFPEFRLGAEGFTVPQFERLLAGLARNVRGANIARRRAFEEATRHPEYFPWDEEFGDELQAPAYGPAFPDDGMLATVCAGVRGWGFGSAPLRFRVDRHDLSSGGVSMPIDPPRDVRVIIHPTAGWVRYMILFHEVGHTVHSRTNDRHSGFPRSYDYIPGFFGLVEGMGTVFEEIPRSAEWLATRPGFDPRRAAAYARAQALTHVGRMRSSIARVRTELALYRNPDADLDEVLLRANRELADFDEVPRSSFVDPFFVDLPVYLSAYVLANLFAKQLLDTALAETGGTIWPNHRLGPWLIRHWFRDSGLFDWAQRLRELTGRPLGAMSFNRWAGATVAADAQTL